MNAIELVCMRILDNYGGPQQSRSIAFSFHDEHLWRASLGIHDPLVGYGRTQLAALRHLEKNLLELAVASRRRAFRLIHGAQS